MRLPTFKRAEMMMSPASVTFVTPSRGNNPGERPGVSRPVQPRQHNTHTGERPGVSRPVQHGWKHQIAYREADASRSPKRQNHPAVILLLTGRYNTRPGESQNRMPRTYVSRSCLGGWLVSGDNLDGYSGPCPSAVLTRLCLQDSSFVTSPACSVFGLLFLLVRSRDFGYSGG